MCAQMHTEASGMSGIIHDYSVTLFIEAGTLDHTQSSLAWLASLTSLLWTCHP